MQNKTFSIRQQISLFDSYLSEEYDRNRQLRLRAHSLYMNAKGGSEQKEKALRLRSVFTGRQEAFLQIMKAVW